MNKSNVMKEIENQEFGGERPLYKQSDLCLRGVVIHVGESSVKEGRNIFATDCRFEGKYVFWEDKKVECKNCYFAPSARSSVWYSRDIKMQDCLVDAPKVFRSARGIKLSNVRLSNAQETFWNCEQIEIDNCTIENADYLFMHSKSIKINNYRQDGNYSFQYAKDVEIHNAIINSKDSFWDSDNCTLVDCKINGEYLGWYSRNLHLIRCHIEGEQPLCYCQNLVLEDCTFADDANLMLEYSSVEATIKGKVTSIKNPTSGHIRVDEVGEIIIDSNQKQPANCQIKYDRICK